MRGTLGASSAVVKAWVDELTKLGEQGETQRTEKNNASWKTWAVEACLKHVEPGHVFTKISPEDLPDPAAKTIQKAADDLTEEWAELSNEEGVELATVSGGEPLRTSEFGPPLPKVSPQTWRETAKTFKRRTGLGTCSFHPRWILHLPDKALEEFSVFMEGFEGRGYWPRLWFTVLVIP